MGRLVGRARFMARGVSRLAPWGRCSPTMLVASLFVSERATLGDDGFPPLPRVPMLLTELAVQNVAGFPPTARVPLKEGLNALVGRESDFIRVLRAVLYPGLENGRALCVGPEPHKAACTVIGRDGATWRVVRDFSSGAQTLLRSDPETGEGKKVSASPTEIARELVVSVGLPPEHAFRTIFSLAADDLPSRTAERLAQAKEAIAKAQAGAAAEPSYDGGPPAPSGLAVAETVNETPAQAKARLPTLRDELHRAESLEKAQDALYELQLEHAAIEKEGEGLRTLEREFEALGRKAQAMVQRTAGVDAALEEKVRRYPDALSRRDATLADIKKRKAQVEQGLGAPTDVRALVRDPLVWGGVAAGVLATVLALVLGIRALWLLNLVAFGVSAFGAWRWVDAYEGSVLGRKRLADLEEATKRAEAQYELDTKPVQQLLKVFEVATPAELQQVFEERDLVLARQIAAERELAARRADPQAIENERRRADAAERIRALEGEINALGFSRDASVVRRELEQVEALAELAFDEIEPLAALVEGASILCGMAPPALVEAMKERIAQYLAALTDRRFIGVRALAPGVCHVVAVSGGAGPLAGLPESEQDAIMVALQLAFAERLGGPAKMPLVVDEPSLLVPPANRMVFVRMLKALGTLTQVLVRAFDAPPPGLVDHVAQVMTKGQRAA